MTLTDELASSIPFGAVLGIARDDGKLAAKVTQTQAFHYG
jgi:hypothetical protein